MILDLPPNIEQIVNHQANTQGISVEEWIFNAIKTKLDKPQDPSPLVNEFTKGKQLKSFGDPLTFQRKIRDEWD